MHTPVDVQVWRLSVLFLVGAASDILFQSYRAFRAVFRPKSLGYHLLDALVSLLFLTGLGTVVFIVNWGELRMYVPLSMFFGAFFTHALVGSALYRRSVRIFAGTKRGLDWSHKNVISPATQAVGRSARWVKTTLFPPIPPSPPQDPEDLETRDQDGIPPASDPPSDEPPPDQPQ